MPPFLGIAPAVGKALIGGLSSLATGFGNILSTNKQNRRSERFADKTYDKQFQDQLRMWHMQNEYNSPKMQAKRFQEAGLNKAMMYGSSGSAAQAASFNTPDTQTPQYRTPDLTPFSNSILAYQDVRIKNAEYDKLSQQNTSIGIQNQLNNVKLAGSLRDFGVEGEIKKFSLDALKENIRQIRIKNSHELDKNILTKAQTSGIKSDEQRKNQRHNLEMQQLVKMFPLQEKKIKVEIFKAQKSGKLDKIRADLMTGGLTPTDPLYYVMLNRALLLGAFKK